MCAGALLVACSHPQNLERKDPLADEVSGSMQPTDRAFLKGDPAARVACRSDAQCPLGALCHPQRNVCFSSAPDMQMTKLGPGGCALVPLYFKFDSVELVPTARAWVDHDANCLAAEGASRVVLKGYADERGDAGYNLDLSLRRAQAVKAALDSRGLDVDVAVRAEGATDPVLKGTTEHKYAYDRRVELDSVK
jgi:hypothetical protein